MRMSGTAASLDQAPVTTPATGAEPSWSVHLALLVTQIAFATLPVEGKLAMGDPYGVDPSALAMARMLGGFGAFAALMAWKRVRLVRSLGDIVSLAGLSLLGVVINQALFLHGLKHTSPLAATLLVATIPVFGAAASVAFGRERATLRMGIGLTIALLGIGILTGFGVPALGDTLVLVNSLAYSLYLALAPGMLAKHGATVTITYVFGFGVLFMAPLGAPALLHGVAVWSPGSWALVGFVVLVPTVVAYLSNTWALARARPSLVAAYVYLQPLIVALLSWVQLGLSPSRRILGAAAAILAGVTIVTGPWWKRSRAG
jgi:drug/metabolite transporter (DMT)-like permease